ARYLYGDPVSFSISGCLFLATNHKPRIADQSTAMWDRIWMIPFRHYFDPTSAVSDETVEYQNSEDFLHEFLHKKNPMGEPVYKIEPHNKTLQIKASDLYAA